MKLRLPFSIQYQSLDACMWDQYMLAGFNRFEIALCAVCCDLTFAVLCPVWLRLPRQCAQPCHHARAQGAEFIALWPAAQGRTEKWLSWNSMPWRLEPVADFSLCCAIQIVTPPERPICLSWVISCQTRLEPLLSVNVIAEEAAQALTVAASAWEESRCHCKSTKAGRSSQALIGQLRILSYPMLGAISIDFDHAVYYTVRRGEAAGPCESLDTKFKFNFSQNNGSRFPERCQPIQEPMFLVAYSSRKKAVL
eukprot:983813-Pelagomonas_calceolata.AAC.6